jgi:hypothetical protein
MRRGFALAALAVHVLSGWNEAAAAEAVDVNFRACETQLKAMLRPDVDCVVEVRPGASTSLPDFLQTLLAGMSCTVPVRFRKAQVYGEWITGNSARTPDFPIQCTLTAAGQTDHVTAAVRIECSGLGPQASCAVVLHSVTGLGIGGRALEKFVNENPELRAALTRTVNPR